MQPLKVETPKCFVDTPPSAVYMVKFRLSKRFVKRGRVSYWTYVRLIWTTHEGQ